MLDDAKVYVDLPKNMRDDDALRFARAVISLYEIIDKHRAAPLAAKVTKLEDLVRRQAMLITKLVREQQLVVDAAKAWRTAYKSEHNLDGARAVRAANQVLAGAVDQLVGAE